MNECVIGRFDSISNQLMC